MLHRSNSWDGQKWFVLPVEWSLNLSDAPLSGTNDTLAAYEAAFMAAADTWENDPDSSFDATYSG